MNKRLILKGFLGSVITLALAVSFTQVALTAFKPVIHRHASDPKAAWVNSYQIETENGVIVIDTSLTISEGKAIRAKIEALKKPLLAVLLTHGHPDHTNGLSEVLGSDNVPVIATEGVDKVMRTTYTPEREESGRKRLGEEWPQKRIFPTKTLRDGESITLGGVTLTVHDLGPGESHSDSYWVLEGDEKVAFIGDEVINRAHAYMADGHSAQWLKNLDRLKIELKDVKTIYPGHGEPGSLEMLDWQKTYIQAYREAVRSLAKGQPTLTEEAKKELQARMEAFLPNAPLTYLILWGADPIAAELAGEK
jgi:glyoxylase-like metal-dependent hydrolase (beta-lactamase superfamily II)